MADRAPPDDVKDEPGHSEEELLHYERPHFLKWVLIALAVAAVVVVVWGIVSRSRAEQGLKQSAGRQAVPMVEVVKPGPPVARDLILPGAIRAYYEAPIYAQVSGYLSAWYADIGTPVRAGALLGVIETPDLDQQLNQAEANLQMALADEKLSAITARRWNQLLAKDAVSQQDADDKNGDLAAKTAAVAAAEANVQRLRASQAFQRIVSPFTGVVTARNTDVGALISVGSPNQTPLFTVDDEHRLRLYVSVPQVDTADVRPGMGAKFTVPEYPGRTFSAVVFSTADAINTATGTLLVQLQADNEAGLLHPGEYAQARFELPADPHALTVPASALVFRDTGMQLAVLDRQDRVAFRDIAVGRDLGTRVEVTAGIGRDDRIVDEPPDVLRPGDVVKPTVSKGGGSAGGTTGGSSSGSASH